MDVSFQPGLYDSDGDLIDHCILLCFEDRFFLRIEDYDEFQSIIKQMLVCYAQAQGNMVSEDDVTLNITLKGHIAAVPDDGMYGLYEEVTEALARAYGIQPQFINPNTLPMLIDEIVKERDKARQSLEIFRLREEIRQNENQRDREAQLQVISGSIDGHQA